MMAGPDLMPFLVGTVVVLAVPGPSLLFVLARTAEGGRSAGLVSVAGLETGLALHVVAAAVGLSAVVASSEAALRLVRYLGAGYLLVLAARELRSLPPAARPGSTEPGPGSRRWPLFREAVVVDALNPKTGLFFLAFLPQFVDPGRGSVALQLLVLGGLVVGVALICDSAYVVASSLVWGGHRRDLAGGAGTPSPAVGRLTGLVYTGLAVLVVLG